MICLSKRAMPCYVKQWQLFGLQNGCLISCQMSEKIFQIRKHVLKKRNELAE